MGVQSVSLSFVGQQHYSQLPHSGHGCGQSCGYQSSLLAQESFLNTLGQENQALVPLTVPLKNKRNKKAIST